MSHMRGVKVESRIIISLLPPGAMLNPSIPAFRRTRHLAQLPARNFYQSIAAF
jgi:hypothetical protein